MWNVDYCGRAVFRTILAKTTMLFVGHVFFFSCQFFNSRLENIFSFRWPLWLDALLFDPTRLAKARRGKREREEEKISFYETRMGCKKSKVERRGERKEGFLYSLLVCAGWNFCRTRPLIISTRLPL